MKKPRPQTLKKFSPNVRYEIQQLKISAHELAKLRIIRNAILESILIHSRSLFGFFTKNSSSKHDAFATHYVSTWDIVKAKSTLKYIDKNLADINQFLAHLSYDRERKVKRRGKKKNWDVTKIAKQMKLVWNSFQKFLPGEFRKQLPEWERL